MKKTAVFILTCLVLFTSVGCFEEDPDRGIEIKYILSESGDYYIVQDGRWCTKERIEIPESYMGLPVKEIATEAFLYCEFIKEVTIHSGIEIIRDEAFSHCINLESVILPETVNYIGKKAFADCYKLKNIEMGDNVEIIEKRAFENCRRLGEVNLPEKLTTIERRAFYNCSELKKINFGSNIQFIGKEAFCYCSGIENIFLPKSIVLFEESVLWGCYNLKTLEIEEGNSRYYSKDNCLVEGETKTIIAGCQTSIIPEDVEIIANNAFGGCIQMRAIKIPSKVRTIGENAFSSCFTLRSIVLPDSVEDILYCAFENCFALDDIVIGKGLKNVGAAAFGDCKSLSAIYYCGSEAEWKKVNVDNYQNYNNVFKNAVNFYSETQPSKGENFWHYVEGVPEKWPLKNINEMKDGALPFSVY